MKKLVKIISYFVLTIIALIIVLTIVAKLAENKITDIALKKISEEIHAPVKIDNVSFNLIRKFPLATIELQNVLLSSPIDESKSDTIISLSKIYISVKSRPLLKGNIEILKVDIDGANINYSVDTSGIANVDFLLSTGEDVEEDTLYSKPLNINLTDFTAKNIVCNYRDSSMLAAAQIYIPNLYIDGKINGEIIIASAKGEVTLRNAQLAGTNLNLMNETDIQFDVDYDNDLLKIKLLEIISDGAKLDLAGNLALGEDIGIDVQFIGNDLIIDELIKYAPDKILKDVGLEKVSGILNLEASVKGIYSKTEMPQVNIAVDFQNGMLSTKEYPFLKNISFNGSVSNGVLRNNQSTQAKFNKFHFETKQSKFDFNFSLLDLDHIKYDVKSELELKIEEFKSFIPDSLINDINGNIKASISTKGEVPDSITDDFIDFVMANTKANLKFSNFNVESDSYVSFNNFSINFDYKPNSIKIDNLNIDVPLYNFELRNSSFDSDFIGSINNLSELSVDLKSYYIKTKGAEISGFLKVKNLENPSYDTDTKIKINLGETIEMLPDSMFKSLSGNTVIDISSKATLNIDSIADQAIEIAFNSSSFNMQLNNISLEMIDDPVYKLENLSGNIKMNPEAILINKMKGVAAGLSFDIDSTEIWNAYKVLIQELDNEIITVQTNVVLGEITNSFLASFTSSESTISEPNEQQNNELINSEKMESSATISDTINLQYLLPNLKEMGIPHFLVRGKLAINKLEYEKNIIDNISLKFRFTDSLYVIDQFKLETCGGEINTSLLLNARGRFWEKPVVDIQSNISNLDIKSLLMVNDNFGDSSITYEKINGKLTSELHLRAFYANGDWLTNKVRAEGHFTLKDGRIYDYEPLVDLSKNKLLGGLKGLDKLDFNTLTTSVFMLNDKIYIPKTDVVTSSMDMSAFAMHSLKGDFEYHLKAYLSDVMKGKSDDLLKKQAKQDKLDGDTFDRDGGLKLLSSEIDGNKKNGLDNKKSRENFKKQLNKQQGWLNLFFNQVNVNFSTDLDRTIRNMELIEKYENKDE